MKHVGELVHSRSIVALPADPMPLAKAVALLYKACQPMCLVAEVNKRAAEGGLKSETLRRARKVLGLITSYADRSGVMWVKAPTLAEANTLVLQALKNSRKNSRRK